MVHDPDFRPIRGRENLSAPPKLESRPPCRDWDRDVFEAFFDPNPQLWTLVTFFPPKCRHEIKMQTCVWDHASNACIKILFAP